MSEQEALNHKIDRTGWDPGPWDAEPDRVDFEHAGFPCLLIRSRMGFLCGYVGLPPEHKYYGGNYDDMGVEVHGGLTYADYCQGAICHVPKPGQPEKVYWVGFDTGHFGDLCPYMQSKKMRGIGIAHDTFTEIYRDIAYVTKETKSLAKQLSKV